MYIYYNNQLTEEAVLSANCQGFQFGYGAFETVLVTKGVPCFLQLHHRRVSQACSKLDIKPRISLDQIFEQAARLVDTNRILEGRLKLICFKDRNQASTILSLIPFQQEIDYNRKAVALTVSSIKRNPHSPMCYIKSLNYAENILAKAEAMRKGYDEALFLNVFDKLCEGAISNIFWIKDNTVYTPEISCGLLEGITRKQILLICHKLNISLRESSYDLIELLQAEEVFVTNSLRGIMPVYKLDNTTYKISENKLVKKLFDEYNKLIDIEINSNKINK